MIRTGTMFGLFVGIYLLFSGALPAQSSGTEEKARWEGFAERITIHRDDYGVPHVYGKTDADAVFGMVYAQCEDDFKRVETNFINALGRMAEVEGISKLYVDLRMRLYIDEEVLRAEYAASPGWLRELMDAWADGINYYLHTHPEVEPMLLTRFEPWMALSFSEGSIGGDIETIPVNPLKAFYDPGFYTAWVYEERDFELEPKGSNGFAIGPDKSSSGNALLMINPHTSFYFRPEVHMVSEEGLNAYGAVTWGQFFIYQGFNAYNGWMHTSAKADAIDLFSLEVEERATGFFYRHGADWKPFKTKVIHLRYKDEEGNMADRSFTTYHSHHGPVIRAEGERWIAIALMVEREKALTQSFTRTKTRSHAEFHETMQLRTNSSNSTVYADKDGTIAYYHGNFVPVRDPSFDWRNTVDGSNPATDWQGLHEVEELIYIKNPATSWIQNCNSTPFTAAGKESPDPKAFPPYVAWDLENARGINAVRVLERTDKLDLDALIQVAYDPALLAFEPLIPALAKAFEELVTEEDAFFALGRAAVDTLNAWNLHTGTESIATSVAVHYGQALLAAGRRLDRPWDAYVFEFLAEAAPAEMQVEALKKALEKLEEDFGSWQTPWGEINRFQRINNSISPAFSDAEESLPVPFNSSQWGSLAAYGSRPYPNTKRWYGNVGNSFVAAVEFGERVVAKSLLAGGQSGNPESPHFKDQAERYVQGDFKPVHYYREDVLEHARESYAPGDRKR